MNTDLHHVIRKGNILKDVHRRFIMFQLLNATQYLHSGGVIHRDQKPSNVLLDCDCNCKIADFGLARSGGLLSFQEFLFIIIWVVTFCTDTPERPSEVQVKFIIINIFKL